MTHRTMRAGALLIGTTIAAALCPVAAHDRASPADAPASTALAPHGGPGDVVMRVRTSNPEARERFERGLRLLWGFNRAAAAAAFRAARTADSDCALCHWAEGYALGPNPGEAMRAENEAPALAAAKRAAGRARTPREAAMAQALLLRHSPELPDRETRDGAFAEAMARTAERFPADVSLRIVEVEALMHLQPRDYWKDDGMTPKGDTARILATLENVLGRAPQHPAALHLYVHVLEASADPGRSNASLPRSPHRRDGTRQWSYRGRALYHFAGDGARGDTDGAGVPGWRVLPALPNGTGTPDPT